MSRKWPVALTLLLAPGLLLAQADLPIPRPDANSQLAHTQLVEKTKQGRVDIYFEGDSITRRWGSTDPQWTALLANWKQNFYGWNAADFAWGGDRIEHILWRLQNGELDGLNPKIFVLMAGTNNIGNRPYPNGDDEKVDDVARGIKAILDLMQQKVPAATIVLTGIIPRNDGPRGVDTVTTINKVNAKIAQFADGKKVRYININDKLADSNGKLLDGMTVDLLHLSAQGCQVWADALKPIFTEILGPPASVDYAPPPTGDPSAAQAPAGQR